MDAKAIIEKIRTAEKKTPVKAYIRTTRPLHFENCHVFTGADLIVMGDYKDIAPVLERNEDAIEDLVVECDRRNSALPLADIAMQTSLLEKPTASRSAAASSATSSMPSEERNMAGWPPAITPCISSGETP